MVSSMQKFGSIMGKIGNVVKRFKYSNSANRCCYIAGIKRSFSCYCATDYISVSMTFYVYVPCKMSWFFYIEINRNSKTKQEIKIKKQENKCAICEFQSSSLSINGVI